MHTETPLGHRLFMLVSDSQSVLYANIIPTHASDGRTNHLIGPQRTSSEPTVAAPRGRGAFRAIAPSRRRSSPPPVKIWSTHMPVPSRLMTGGFVFLRLWTFSRALFSSFFYIPHPFFSPLDCLHIPSPPHSFLPSRLSFLSSPFLEPLAAAVSRHKPP